MRRDGRGIPATAHRIAIEPELEFYAAKCFWPRVTAADLERVAASATQEAALVSCEGQHVDYVGSLLFPDDELVLCLFAGTSSAAVKCTNERAGIP